MQRWKLSALAAASLALSSLAATDAWALALGRITVQSALGEPLRAEVEIPQLSAAEADSLQAAIASPAAFRAQGMEYTGTANSVRVKVQKRTNGTAVLQLSSAQPVNDPFVDLVIDTNWASGKLQRNYTLLLDPPASRRPAPAPVAAAQVAPAEPAARPVRPAVVEPAPAAAAGRDLRNDRDQGEASAKRKRQASAAAPAAGSGELRVKTGDTAGRIAAAYKPAGVSLDQMLVAMLRSNPQAFVDGNVNRMRSGAVVQLPDEAAAQATSAKEARQIMAAQSRDFNQFRRQLAGVAPVAPVEAASRAASGQVQAHVEDSKAGTAAPDKLTLSKGSVKGAAADEHLAQQKQAVEQSARTDELKRNMAELSQIAAATKPAGSAAAPAAGGSAPSAAPGLAVPAATVAGNAAASTTPAAPAAAPAAAAETAKPEAAPAAEPAAAATPAANAPAADASPVPAAEAPAPAPAPAAKPKPAPAPLAPPEEPSFIDGLMDDPAIPLAGAALLALLLGYGGYRVAQRRKAAAAASTDSSLGDSQLAADSFFGASGGQRVDTTTTNSSQLSGQSMHYSPSQLDAGDVDPLAEADVYLAYGRDLQAEEILKEALRSDPNRLVLHQKLAEIYAKRHDRIAYAAVANNLYALTQGKGPEWLRLADQGRILDPDNQLYQPGGSPLAQSAAASAAGPVEAASGLMGAATAGMGFGAALASAHSAADDREGPPTMPSGLEFDLNRPEPQAVQPAAPQNLGAQPQWEAPAAAAEPSAAADNSLNIDLNDLASFSLPTAQAPVAEPVTEAPVSSLNALEFDLDSFSLPLTSEAAPATAPASTDQTLSLDEETGAAEPMVPPSIGSASQSEPSFDLSGLSLDLGTPETASGAGPTSLPAEPEDPLATKLALAEEFNAIGDSDGARTLMEEVIAEAHGDLKARAQSLLSQIG
ncbi:FimV/HubP family polar landmark protein [Comamonas guangdongensis]|uniref:FimV/HubP family polar landmark protein n=1 Tax=Comamonas guangdongensis TaxID=510515 RepID=A0ABV3ZNQ1_9BURK